MSAIAERPIYTPYEGVATPFTIGLSQLDLKDWVEPDADLAFFLDEKKRVLAERYDDVFRAEDDTMAAQQEVLDLYSQHLTKTHANLYKRNGNMVSVAGHIVDITDSETPPLLRAGALIQDDLILMRKRDDEWSLAAAFLAFPSSWSLVEKFAKPMDEIHANVPGFEGGTRNAALIARMFDNLQVERPVKRLNWSLQSNNALPQPINKHLGHAPEKTSRNWLSNFVRVERQTLRKLPVSGDILFTVRIYVDPFIAIAASPDAAQLFSGMAAQLEAMTESQVDYKGLTEMRAPLIAFLRAEAAKAA